MTEVWQDLEHIAVMLELAGLTEMSERAKAAVLLADQAPERAAEVLRELSAEVRALAPVFATARKNQRFR